MTTITRDRSVKKSASTASTAVAIAARPSSSTPLAAPYWAGTASGPVGSAFVQRRWLLGSGATVEAIAIGTIGAATLLVYYGCHLTFLSHPGAERIRRVCVVRLTSPSTST